jgi:hypothetical protein
MARSRDAEKSITSILRNALFAVTLLAPALSFAQDAPPPDDILLRCEFWTELAPRPDFEVDPAPFDPAEPTKEILAEAAFVYSGMIRGFSVSYVPYDKARAVEESMEVKPLLENALKNEKLIRGEYRVVKNNFRAYVNYVPDASERAYYLSWRSIAYPVANGEGKALLGGGAANRVKAIEDGIKDAVREYARTKVKNKPRLVRAVAALERPPSLLVRAGNYVARVRIRLKIEEIIPYAAY